MLLETLAVGPFQANCYVLGDNVSRQAMVIDPGAEFDRVWDRITKLNLKVGKIVLTHAHGDHIGAVSELKERTGAELLLHKDDYPLLTDPRQNGSQNYGIPIAVKEASGFLKEDGEISCDSIRLKVIHTPGHTPGGICLLGEKVLLTGDTLFNGSIGRTDFSYSSLEKLLHALETKILPLDDETKIYPGHGPASKLGWERRYNPFLQKSFLSQYRSG